MHCFKFVLLDEPPTIAPNPANFDIVPTAKMNTRTVLPMCQDEFELESFMISLNKLVTKR